MIGDEFGMLTVGCFGAASMSSTSSILGIAFLAFATACASSSSTSGSARCAQVLTAAMGVLLRCRRLKSSASKVAMRSLLDSVYAELLGDCMLDIA